VKIAAAALIALVSAAPASADNRATISPRELADAVNRAGVRAVPYLKGVLSPRDIRSVRCLGPDEEPTEFQCSWRQRTEHGWKTRRTWLAIDGEGWHVIG
jgi:hypothetical protein